LPAVVLGLLFGKAIKAHLFTPVVVASTFIVGGFIILWAERRPQTATRIHEVDDMTPLDALKVGLVQCLAMVPGTSRSGATIIGGMLLGLSRKAATDFSFFLAIPTLIGAGAYSLYKERALLSALADAADVCRGAGVLVHQRLAVRALAAALHQHPQLCALCLVPHRVWVVVLAVTPNRPVACASSPPWWRRASLPGWGNQPATRHGPVRDGGRRPSGSGSRPASGRPERRARLPCPPRDG
jgi:undecaprenyl pyrophosphate phosphatase UppP